MRPSANGVTIQMPSLSNPGLAQLTSVVKRSGFDMDAFGIADRPGEVPKGTKVILSLGEENLRMLTGEVGIGRYRGHVLNQLPFVVPTYSPSFLLPKRGEENSSKFTGVMIRDIRYAIQIAKEGFERKPTNYLIDPGAQKAEQWAEDYARLLYEESSSDLAHDLETEYKSKQDDESELETRDNLILRVGFAYRDTEALTIPWIPEYLPTIKFLYSTTGGKVGWNSGGFDLPVLEANGISPKGEQYDAIDAWHVYQPGLPRKLEFVASFFSDILPWKHTNRSDFANYNAKDTDATIRIWNGLKRDMLAIPIPVYQESAA